MAATASKPSSSSHSSNNSTSNSSSIYNPLHKDDQWNIICQSLFRIIRNYLNRSFHKSDSNCLAQFTSQQRANNSFLFHSASQITDLRCLLGDNVQTFNLTTLSEKFKLSIGELKDESITVRAVSDYLEPETKLPSDFGNLVQCFGKLNSSKIVSDNALFSRITQCINLMVHYYFLQRCGVNCVNSNIIKQQIESGFIKLISNIETGPFNGNSNYNMDVDSKIPFFIRSQIICLVTHFIFIYNNYCIDLFHNPDELQIPPAISKVIEKWLVNYLMFVVKYKKNAKRDSFPMEMTCEVLACLLSFHDWKSKH